MTEKNEITKGVARHRAVYAAVGTLIGWAVNLVMQHTYERYRPKSETFLLLANHNTNLDPVYEVLGLKRHMRFVASENVTKGFWGSIVSFLAGPIPRPKGASADETVRLIEANLANGVSVALHAEGNRSWDGETGFISPRTAQMIKDSEGGLITYLLEGGYLKTPRWAKYNRRGPIHGRVIREYTREEIDKLSVGEIYEIICRDLYTDAFEEQRRNMRRYRGRRLAEGLETLFFVCPACEGVGTITSHGDSAGCSACGYGMKYNEYGFFEGENLTHETVLDWSRWQKRWLRENTDTLKAHTCDPISSDSGLELYRRAGGGRETLLENAVSWIYGDRLEISSDAGSFIFPLEKISALGVFGVTRLYFTCDGVYHEVFAKNHISGSKYFALWRVLTGKDYK